MIITQIMRLSMLIIENVAIANTYIYTEVFNSQKLTQSYFRTASDLGLKEKLKLKRQRKYRLRFAASSFFVKSEAMN
jgi:hypothetical protein